MQEPIEAEVSKSRCGERANNALDLLALPVFLPRTALVVKTCSLDCFAVSSRAGLLVRPSPAFAARVASSERPFSSFPVADPGTPWLHGVNAILRKGGRYVVEPSADVRICRCDSLERAPLPLLPSLLLLLAPKRSQRPHHEPHAALRPLRAIQRGLWPLRRRTRSRLVAAASRRLPFEGASSASLNTPKALAF